MNKIMFHLTVLYSFLRHSYSTLTHTYMYMQAYRAYITADLHQSLAYVNQHTTPLSPVLTGS